MLLPGEEEPPGSPIDLHASIQKKLEHVNRLVGPASPTAFIQGRESVESENAIAQTGEVFDEESELRVALEMGKEPAEVFTELLRDYSQFLTELGELAGGADQSEEVLSQLDILDGSAHELLLELDAGVEAVRHTQPPYLPTFASALVRVCVLKVN